ncbi:acetyltransferase [Streptomyces eurocidicus]|uniref:Acetyltransferase n=1 Tax=Streptomyces eurocidicus TaxID=66423 RepID=A0A2N8NX48_STREU|nr:GNAT family N-acetyltransferase [Streptomyces eurocidicus]MBB5117828.1 GNAT superfamily N-acetyltransferase [Streptomyces eurocidicus]MBF6056392.1 GNAT family N-acetyltransferase [Streptomyces eurocidicus]PNE33344.1 acetyltransferase [Streptomyces eurocidicus]
MDHLIRTVRADEWAKVKELRLTALADPVAPIAFLDTYANAVVQPDAYWKGRTETAAEGRTVCAFVAEDQDGEWAGTLTVFLELPGEEGTFGGSAAVPQTHVAGVFVRPEHRGTGITQALFRAALDWSWSLSEPRAERARLYVHEGNGRAQALYRKLGFERTGVVVPMAGDPSSEEYEMTIARPAC